MAKKTLAQLLEERYESQEVREAIRQEIANKDTGRQIEAGLLTLPTEHDAINHIERERIRKEQEARILRGGV